MFMDGASMFILFSSRLECLWMGRPSFCAFFWLFGVREIGYHLKAESR